MFFIVKQKRFITFILSFLLIFNISFNFKVQKAEAIAIVDDGFYIYFLLAFGTVAVHNLVANSHNRDVINSTTKSSFSGTMSSGSTSKTGAEIKADLKKTKEYYNSKSSFTTAFSADSFISDEANFGTSATFKSLGATFDVMQSETNDYYWYATLNGMKIKNGSTYTFSNGKSYTFNYAGSYDSTYIMFRSCYTAQQTKKPYFSAVVENNEIRLKLNYLLYLNSAGFSTSTFIGNVQNLMSTTSQKSETEDFAKALDSAIQEADTKLKDNTTYTVKAPANVSYSEPVYQKYNAMTNTYTYVATQDVGLGDTSELDGRIATLETQVSDVNSNLGEMSGAIADTNAQIQTLSTDVAESKSVIQSISDWLANTYDWLIALPGAIYNYFVDTLQDIIEAIKAIPQAISDFIKFLFIPNFNNVNEQINLFNNFINNKFNFSTDFLTQIRDADPSELEDIKMPNPVNLDEMVVVINFSFIRQHISTIRVFTSMTMIFLCFVYVINCVFRILRGSPFSKGSEGADFSAGGIEIGYRNSILSKETINKLKGGGN